MSYILLITEGVRRDDESPKTNNFKVFKILRLMRLAKLLVS